MPKLESRSKRRAASPDARRANPEPASVTGPEQPSGGTALASGVAETPKPEAPAEPVPERLGLTLKIDGTIDTDTMRSATRDKLKKALGDQSLFSRLGITSSTTETKAADDMSAMFYPMVSGILYDTCSKLMMVAALKSGYPKEQVIALAFTPQEIQQLTPLTGKIIEKWLPISGKYADEAMLGIMLFGMINGKLMLLQKPGTVIKMAPPPAPESETGA